MPLILGRAEGIGDETRRGNLGSDAAYSYLNALFSRIRYEGIIITATNYTFPVLRMLEKVVLGDKFPLLHGLTRN